MITLSLYEQTIPAFTQMLSSLSAVLSKGEQLAETKKFNPANLLNARLAPDMLSLINQVQIACDSAKFAIARVANVEAPKFDDQESSFAQLQERIRNTLTFIQSVSRETFDAGTERTVEWQSRGQTLRMPAPQYIRSWAMANFYFHVTTAYALLRHNGVDIGKRDYLGSFMGN